MVSQNLFALPWGNAENLTERRLVTGITEDGVIAPVRLDVIDPVCARQLLHQRVKTPEAAGDSMPECNAPATGAHVKKRIGNAAEVLQVVHSSGRGRTNRGGTLWVLTLVLRHQ